MISYSRMLLEEDYSHTTKLPSPPSHWPHNSTSPPSSVPSQEILSASSLTAILSCLSPHPPSPCSQPKTLPLSSNTILTLSALKYSPCSDILPAPFTSLHSFFLLSCSSLLSSSCPLHPIPSLLMTSISYAVTPSLHRSINLPLISLLSLRLQTTHSPPLSQENISSSSISFQLLPNFPSVIHLKWAAYSHFLEFLYSNFSLEPCNLGSSSETALTKITDDDLLVVKSKAPLLRPSSSRLPLILLIKLSCSNRNHDLDLCGLDHI